MKLGFAAFTSPNVCSLDLSLLFVVPVGRDFLFGICKLKPKNLENLKPQKKSKNLFFVKKTRVFPAIVCVAVIIKNDFDILFNNGLLNTLVQ